MKGKYWEREVLPFAAMVIVQISSVGSSILFKAATTKGMSYLVFMVYTYALSSLFTLPLAFFFHRKSDLPPFTISLLGRILFLTIIGFCGQTLGYKGIECSDPTLASAISNLTPAFTFALAIIFRMEKVSISSASSRAKIMGTIVSISGALIVVLYAGPRLINQSSSSILHNHSLIGSLPSEWVLGGFLLICDYLLFSVWFIFQAQIVKMYPAEFIVVFVSNVCAFIIAAPVSFIAEHDLNKWKLRADSALVAILYAGAIGASGVVVQTWGLRVKGPFYVASFSPLSIAVATVMSVIFLGDSLYLGCAIGALLITVGFYVVMWGKVKEADMVEDSAIRGLDSSATENVPLLVDV